MNTNRNKSIVAHMIQYCDQINEAMSLFGSDYEIFATNNTYRNACCLCLLQIGELTYSLTDEFKNAHPDIPWKQIRGFRNIVAHAYGTVEPEIVWEIITSDIPVLREYCEKILPKMG